MSNTGSSGNRRQTVILVAIVLLACLALVCLAGVGYALFGPGIPGLPDLSGATASPTRPVETATATRLLEEPSATPVSATLAAPATLGLVTTAPDNSPLATATATPPLLTEPTLLVTNTPEPTTSGSSGPPAPRLANHTDCQNSISEFGRDNLIEFRWTWNQRVNSDDGFYLEVRIGPRGATNLASMGAINDDALLDPAQNLWQARIPVAQFYQVTANDYEWQVAYMNNNQRVVVASGRGCFNIR